MTEPYDLDAIDLRLLALLRDDGRRSVSSLARDAGIARATAYSRLEKLVAGGAIQGYTLRTDPKRLGLGVTAIVLLSFRQGDWLELRATFAKMPEIENFVLTTGAYDAFILVRLPDMEALRRFLFDHVQMIPSVRASQTVLVLEEVTNLPFVLPSSGDASRP